jgi:hypothetical protein
MDASEITFFLPSYEGDTDAMSTWSHTCSKILEHNFELSIARNLPVGLHFTPGTQILFRPDVLCDMPSHPVGHVFQTLQWNSLGRASFEVHESQRDLRLGKLVFQMLLCGECYENVYT